MIRYGRVPWGDRFPASRVPSYPRFRAPRATGAVETVDVVIVGGGLTGCAAAYALAAAGVKAILLEADRVGRGNSIASAGWISDDPGVPFAEAANLLGVRIARHGFEAWRRAALDFSALLRRLEIKCHLEPHTALTIAMTPEQTQRLKKERKVRLEAGLDAPALTLALRGREDATIDPYRACVGLAAAAEERGAKLFERSPVKRITFNRKIADVFTAD